MATGNVVASPCSLNGLLQAAAPSAAGQDVHCWAAGRAAGRSENIGRSRQEGEAAKARLARAQRSPLAELPSSNNSSTAVGAVFSTKPQQDMSPRGSVAGYLPPSHVNLHRGVPRQPQTTSMRLTTTSAKEVALGTRIMQPFKTGARDIMDKFIKPQPKQPRQQQEHGKVYMTSNNVYVTEGWHQREPSPSPSWSQTSSLPSEQPQQGAQQVELQSTRQPQLLLAKLGARHAQRAAAGPRQSSAASTEKAQALVHGLHTASARRAADQQQRGQSQLQQEVITMQGEDEVVAEVLENQQRAAERQQQQWEARLQQQLHGFAVREHELKTQVAAQVAAKEELVQRLAAATEQRELLEQQLAGVRMAAAEEQEQSQAQLQQQRAQLEQVQEEAAAQRRQLKSLLQQQATEMAAHEHEMSAQLMAARQVKEGVDAEKLAAVTELAEQLQQQLAAARKAAAEEQDRQEVEMKRLECSLSLHKGWLLSQLEEVHKSAAAQQQMWEARLQQQEAAAAVHAQQLVEQLAACKKAEEGLVQRLAATTEQSEALGRQLAEAHTAAAEQQQGMESRLQQQAADAEHRGLELLAMAAAREQQEGATMDSLAAAQQQVQQLQEQLAELQATAAEQAQMVAVMQEGMAAAQQGERHLQQQLALAQQAHQQELSEQEGAVAAFEQELMQEIGVHREVAEQLHRQAVEAQWEADETRAACAKLQQLLQQQGQLEVPQPQQQPRFTTSRPSPCEACGQLRARHQALSKRLATLEGRRQRELAAASRREAELLARIGSQQGLRVEQAAGSSEARHVECTSCNSLMAERAELQRQLEASMVTAADQAAHHSAHASQQARQHAEERAHWAAGKAACKAAMATAQVQALAVRDELAGMAASQARLEHNQRLAAQRTALETAAAAAMQAAVVDVEGLASSGQAQGGSGRGTAAEVPGLLQEAHHSRQPTAGCAESEPMAAGLQAQLVAAVVGATAAPTSSAAPAPAQQDSVSFGTQQLLLAPPATAGGMALAARVAQGQQQLAAGTAAEMPVSMALGAGLRQG